MDNLLASRLDSWYEEDSSNAEVWRYGTVGEQRGRPSGETRFVPKGWSSYGQAEAPTPVRIGQAVHGGSIGESQAERRSKHPSRDGQFNPDGLGWQGGSEQRFADRISAGQPSKRKDESVTADHSSSHRNGKRQTRGVPVTLELVPDHHYLVTVLPDGTVNKIDFSGRIHDGIPDLSLEPELQVA